MSDIARGMARVQACVIIETSSGAYVVTPSVAAKVLAEHDPLGHNDTVTLIQPGLNPLTLSYQDVQQMRVLLERTQVETINLWLSRTPE